MERKPFPTEQESFGDDERVSYSKTTQTYILEDENGIEWEWLPTVNKWTQTISEEEMMQQAEAYKVAGVDENAPALNPAQKRKQAQLEDLETNPKAAKSGPGAANAGTSANANADGTNAGASASANSAPATRKNTAIWVTGLPTDANRDELTQFFAKFGMIKESVEDDSKRIKMYADDEGNFNGEALIIYHGPESVANVIRMYDGQPLRLGDNSTKMSIQPADSSYKSQQGNTVKEGGNKPKPSKAKLKSKAEEVNRRLEVWSDDEEPVATTKSKAEQFKMVAIRNAFTLHLLDEDAELKSALYDDMKDEGQSHGVVKNVTVYDKERSGLVTVRFADAAAAKAFATAVHGRSYNKRILRTELVSGSDPKWERTHKTEAEKDEEEKKRIEEYSNYIEGKE